MLLLALFISTVAVDALALMYVSAIQRRQIHRATFISAALEGLKWVAILIVVTPENRYVGILTAILATICGTYLGHLLQHKADKSRKRALLSQTRTGRG